MFKVCAFLVAAVALNSVSVAVADQIQISFVNGFSKHDSTLAVTGEQKVEVGHFSDFKPFSVSKKDFTEAMKSLHCSDHLGRVCYNTEKPSKLCKEPYDDNPSVKVVSIKMVPTRSEITGYTSAPLWGDCQETYNDNSWPICQEKDHGHEPGWFCKKNPTYDEPDCNCTANNLSTSVILSFDQSGNITHSTTQTYSAGIKAGYSYTTETSDTDTDKTTGSFEIEAKFSEDKTNSQEKSISLDFSENVAIDVEPGVTQFNYVTFTQTTASFSVHYDASMVGEVAAMYNNQCGGHYFKYNTINKALRHAKDYRKRNLTQTPRQDFTTQANYDTDVLVYTGGKYSSCTALQKAFEDGKL